jgi:hypothetical protein
MSAAKVEIPGRPFATSPLGPNMTKDAFIVGSVVPSSRLRHQTPNPR